jgi:hypothetical protein
LLAVLRITGGTAAALAVLAGLVIQQPDRLAQIQARFEHDPDPIHKAKLMPDLGTAEFQEVQKHLAAGNLSDALLALEKFRDAAENCKKELDAKNIDAEKHPAGYKQLEISLRSSLRRIDDLVVGLAADEQKPFLNVRKEIQQLDHHVMRQLFPRQPGAGSDVEVEKQKP